MSVTYKLPFTGRRIPHSQTWLFHPLLFLFFILVPALTAEAQVAAIPDGYSQTVLDVKVIPGLSLERLQTLIADQFEGRLVDVKPLISLPADQLSAISAVAVSKSQTEVPDLTRWFRITLQSEAEALGLLQVLRDHDQITLAGPAPKPAPPPAATPDFTGNQGYLEAATDGIDAEFSWTIPGGNGAGIKIIDVEYSWNQSHEDLSKAAGVAFLLDTDDSAVDPFADNNHGTAVLGELIGDNDNKGVTGISWGSSIGLAPANTDDHDYNLANAIILAIAGTSIGDIILIEQQIAVCDLDGPCTGGNCGPSEWDDPVFDAIVLATAAGRIVVEAAGNGGVNLDQEDCDDKFDRNNRDSGAIIVGQAWPPGDTDRERRPNSSYGSRVDLQGWGSSVMTTGYGTSYVNSDDPTNPNFWYLDNFSGTSSASPIVAGAAANLQGINLSAHGITLLASQIRNILVSTGSPQLGNTSQHIGPRPNLAAAIAEIINLPPVADAGPDQTLECTGFNGASVTLDGSGSSDPNPGDMLTYEWIDGFDTVIATGVNPTVTLPLGIHPLTLKVTDSGGLTDTDDVSITVEDTTPPTLSLIGDDPLTLECGFDEYIEPGAAVGDICDASPTLDIDTTDVDTETPGTYTVFYTATDASGNETLDERTVEVVDTTPPVITVNEPTGSLWPPDHKYRIISLDSLDLVAEDECDETVSAADIFITVVSSDEPEDAKGGGDGKTTDDIVISSCREVDLRAERQAGSDGRVYELTLNVADASGNVGSATYQVHVPRDINLGPLAVDDGPLYSVAACSSLDEAAIAKGTGPTTPSKTAAETPDEYRLGQNYPNPFNPMTEISFQTPESARVRLIVYDLMGRQVASLVDEFMPAGVHRARWIASTIPSGTYLYQLTAGTFKQAKYMVLLK